MTAEQQGSATKALTPAAQRILDTASDLFFRHGIRAVGVDTIAAESGVTKMTLYKHFGSKDALVAAHLRVRDQRWRARWHEALQHTRQPIDRLFAVFDAYERAILADDFRGCAFVNAAAELPDLDHPARAVVSDHKLQLRDDLAGLAAEAGLRAPQEVAEELLLLLEGGFAVASIRHDTEPVRRARRLAERLLDDRFAADGR